MIGLSVYVSGLIIWSIPSIYIVTIMYMYFKTWAREYMELRRYLKQDKLQDKLITIMKYIKHSLIILSIIDSIN